MGRDRLFDDAKATSRFRKLWGDPDTPPWDVHRCTVEREKLELLAPHATHAQRVLDVGCGGGDFLQLLCERMGLRFPYVAGLDIAHGALARAKRTGLYDRLECCAMSAVHEVFDDRFDLVLASDVLYYSADYRTALARLSVLLAPGGLLFTSVAIGSGYFGADDCAALEDTAVQHGLVIRARHRIDYRVLGWPRTRIPLARFLWPQTQKQIWVYARR